LPFIGQYCRLIQKNWQWNGIRDIFEGESLKSKGKRVKKMSEFEFFSGRNRKNGWYGLAIMVVVLVILFFLVTSLFKILYYLSPLLLVLTLIFDYHVVIKYGKMIVRYFRKNWLFGLLLAILTVVGFPIVTGGLFVNAFMNWRIKRAKKQYGQDVSAGREKFSEYELIEGEEELDLAEMEKLRENKQ
jgi:hypothetical protein